jgi:hypothetical protein
LKCRVLVFTRLERGVELSVIGIAMELNAMSMNKVSNGCDVVLE